MKSKNKMDYSKLDIESVRVANEMYNNIKDEGEKMSAKFNFYKGFNKALELVEKQQEQMYSEEDMREGLFHALYSPKKDGYIEKTIDEIVRETMSIFKNK